MNLGGNWQVIDESTCVLSREYRTGPYLASTFVFGLGEGKLCICSPPVADDLSIYDSLDKHGKVTAIVAPNSLHHAGVGQCAARYPDAVVYSPEDAAKRIRKKGVGIPTTIAPLDGLVAMLPDSVELLVPPHLKMSETFARVKTPSGYVWYMADILGNMAALPSNPIFKFFYWITKSGPGFAVNRFVSMFFVKDKKRFRDWLLQEIETFPPSTIVVGHGKPVEGTGIASQLRAMVEAAF